MKRRRKIERVKEKMREVKYQQKVEAVPAWLKERLNEKLEQERKNRAGEK